MQDFSTIFQSILCPFATLTEFWNRLKSTDNNDINIYLSLESPTTFLLAKEKTWKRIFCTNSELSQSHTEKQIMPSKTTVKWLFNIYDVIYSLFVLFEKSAFFNKQLWGFIISLNLWQISKYAHLSISNWGQTSAPKRFWGTELLNGCLLVWPSNPYLHGIQ